MTELIGKGRPRVCIVLKNVQSEETFAYMYSTAQPGAGIPKDELLKLIHRDWHAHGTSKAIKIPADYEHIDLEFDVVTNDWIE